MPMCSNPKNHGHCVWKFSLEKESKGLNKMLEVGARAWPHLFGDGVAWVSQEEGGRSGQVVRWHQGPENTY